MMVDLPLLVREVDELVMKLEAENKRLREVLKATVDTLRAVDDICDLYSVLGQGYIAIPEQIEEADKALNKAKGGE